MDSLEISKWAVYWRFPNGLTTFRRWGLLVLLVLLVLVGLFGLLRLRVVFTLFSKPEYYTMKLGQLSKWTHHCFWFNLALSAIIFLTQGSRIPRVSYAVLGYVWLCSMAKDQGITIFSYIFITVTSIHIIHIALYTIHSKEKQIPESVVIRITR